MKPPISAPCSMPVMRRNSLRVFHAVYSAAQPSRKNDGTIGA